MEEIDLAYMAGIMDGEGCIHIGCNHHPTSGLVKPYYWLESMIGMTDRYICDLFHTRFGGTVRNTEKATEKWRAKWMWRISGKQAAEMLNSLLPYLRLKHKQAELALEFQKRRQRWGSSGKPHDAEILDENDYTLMRNLKKESM
jgi:hypothetical protein